MVAPLIGTAATAVVSELFPALLKALASEVINDETIRKWVGFAGEAVASGVAVEGKLQALVDEIERMVAEDRNPTTDEWEALRQRSDVAHATIQNWKPGQPS